MDSMKIIRDFELLKNISKQENDRNFKVNLKKIEKMIHEIIPSELEKNAPPNFPELFFDFKGEYEKFRDFILYEKLIGKNIVALGGGFSSGKSSFLNSFMGKKNILPSAITPSTSVPAYIVHGEEEQVHGINVFDTSIKLQMSDIKIIAHGFGEMEDENEEILTDEVTLGHILESLFISTPEQSLKNIAFLDTPGYSKPDTADYSRKTDEKISRIQLNGSNFILWFIQADQGTITEEDIKFINTLDKSIPKLFIVNKADKKTDKDLIDIVEKIKDIVDTKGIQYVDVLTYSRRNSDAYDGVKIKAYLQSWDKKIEKTNFAYNFKVLFVKCREYYESKLQEEGKRLNRLNTALTLSNDEIINECLASLSKDIANNQQSLKNINQRLKQMQDEFFTEIKLISDVVGIEMPEPSEIDLLQDKVINPLEIIKSYKKKHNIKDNLKIRAILEDSFVDIDPEINRIKGGSGYKEELLKVINTNLIFDREKIRFNSYLSDIQETAKNIKEKLA